MHLPLNQRGISQILLPLLLIAAIGLTVYVAQQRTNLIPFAAQSTGECSTHLNPNPETAWPTTEPDRRVIASKVTESGAATLKTRTQKATSEGFAVRFEWSDGRTSFDFKDQGGKLLKDKSYSVRPKDGKCEKSMKRGGDNDRALVDGITVVTVFEDGTIEFNKFFRNGTGTEEILYNPDLAYSKCCDKNYQFSEGTTVNPTTTGSKNANEVCTDGNECKSGTCTNKKCASSGSKSGGDSCTDGIECQSGTCSNKKCAGGSAATGKTCDADSDCASNKCGADSKCTASSKSSSSPKASSGGGNSGGGGSTASTTPAASVAPSSSTPTASSPASSTPVSLTKTEITGFKASFDALYTRLAATKDTGNLKIVSSIANTELTSIVSQLSTCPDDANVGTCLDSKFRTRFDLAKTAARLSAFYGIFNTVSGLCVKSDFGLNPLITATSTTSASGRVNLCSESTAAGRIWKIFVNNKFEDIISTDARFPTNPTCATLPQDVLTHYRNAETLFNTQAGFIQNTLCDGKTSVAPGGGT